MPDAKTKVLILGGGFGGVKAALNLADNRRYSVTLMSDQDEFRYYPALYLAATGGDTSASSIPLFEIFAGKRVKIIHDTAKTLNRDSKTIKGSSGKNYSYDLLVVALGMVTNYFGIKGLKQYSYGLKSQAEARELRDHLHKQLADKNTPDLNYVVIGGGATGVELAGALPFYLRHIMTKHMLPPKKIHIDLVEAESRLMPRMPRAYSSAVQKRLRRLGIRLHLNQKVEAESAGELTFSGHSVKSRSVIWTAGVACNPFLAANKFNLNERGKVIVNHLLQAEDDICVIGDNAATTYSGMAQTALHDGLFVAENLNRISGGHPPKPYKPRKPVYVTPAGPYWAAVQWGQLQLYGRLGWSTRQAADLIGYHDLQPWWPAYKNWVASNTGDEYCAICMRS
ncbi:MAG TPA: FAD-dependent oxidoreductase [Candidatus Saccharimonadales bacterium]|nr:FAD-dependent oxidoreductase [Candidatus Saccharimonadales bacterium]